MNERIEYSRGERLIALAGLAVFAVLLPILAGSGDTGLVLVGSITIAGLLVLWAIRPAVFAMASGFLYLVLLVFVGEDAIVYVGQYGIKPTQIAAAAMTGLVAIRAIPGLFRVGIRHLIGPVIFPAACFLVSGLISLLMSREPEVAAGALFHVAGVFVALLFGIATGRDRHAIRTYRIGTLAAGALTAGSAIRDYIALQGGDIIPRAGALRAAGLFGRANITADVIFVSTPVALDVVSRSRRAVVRAAAACVLVVFLIGLLLTFTRAAIMGTILVIAYVVGRPAPHLATHIRRRRRLAAGVAIVVAVVVGGAILDEGTVRSRLEDIPGLGAQGLSNDAGSGRVRIWRAVLSEQVRSSPTEWAIGHGLVSTLDATRRRLNEPWLAHNSYLEVLYNQGLIGLVAFIATMIGIVRVLARRGNACPIAVQQAVLVAAFCLSTDLFTSAVFSYVSRWYLFIMAGALMTSADGDRSG